MQLPSETVIPRCWSQPVPMFEAGTATMLPQQHDPLAGLFRSPPPLAQSSSRVERHFPDRDVDAAFGRASNDSPDRVARPLVSVLARCLAAARIAPGAQSVSTCLAWLCGLISAAVPWTSAPVFLCAGAGSLSLRRSRANCWRLWRGRRSTRLKPCIFVIGMRNRP